MTRVINSPCAASRARVDCVQYSSQSGFIDKPCSSQSTCARVRVRGRLSLDEHVAKFDDPGKIATFSDCGAGEERIFARYDERDKARQIADALRRLSPKDRRFASAVLRGATWRELGIGKRGFNKRLAKICKRLIC